VLEFGVAAPDDVAAVRPHDLFSRELTLLGSVINPWTHQRAVALLPRLGLDRLTTAFYGLDQFDEALAAQRRGDVDKVFVAPAGEAAARGG
jgi:threonine dehydrogenase-like Zn-dependent dehydrogenase